MKKRTRLLVVLLLLAFAGLLLYPTINWYFMFSEGQRELALAGKDQVRYHVQDVSNAEQQQLINLFKENQDAELPAELKYLISYAEQRRPENRPAVWTALDIRKAYHQEDRYFEEDLLKDMRDYHYKQVEKYKEVQEGIILKGLDLAGGINIVLAADIEGYKNKLIEEEVDVTNFDERAVMMATMTSLTDRLDNFGLVEPQVRILDENLINVQLPGEYDPTKIYALLLGENSLTFNLIDNEADEQLQTYIAANPGFRPDDPAFDVSNIVRAGLRVVEYTKPDEYGYDQFIKWVVIEETNAITGADIESARTSISDTEGVTVNFNLSNEGTTKFAKFTGANVGKNLAGVLGNKLKFYASIRAEINSPNVQMTGVSQDEATYIAQILQSASLPVNLSVESVESIGSTLGDQAIEIGLLAIAIGLALVVVFMFAYYKGAGLIASVALVLNLAFIIAALSAFNLTLTLTSIAGLVLTVGMAVDANVIIFERIKEEYRLGKSAAASVTAGYEKAFSTIVDANITTFIAALFLSLLGTGPVQGFAITLAVGVFCSVVTAIFITRLMFDFGIENFKSEKLSITWERR